MPTPYPHPDRQAASLIHAVLVDEMREQPDVTLWPASTEDVPDHQIAFHLAILDLRWAEYSETQRLDELTQLVCYRGHTRRLRRNALGLVPPSSEGVEASVQFALEQLSSAGGSLEAAKQQAQTSASVLQQWRERFVQLYSSIYLPVAAPDDLTSITFEMQQLELDPTPKAPLGGCLWRGVAAHLRDDLAVAELIEATGLGSTDCKGFHRVLFPLQAVPRWFFSYLNLPRLRNCTALHEAICRGIEDGELGLLPAEHILALDRLPAELQSHVLCRRAIQPESIDFNAPSYLVAREVLAQ